MRDGWYRRIGWWELAVGAILVVLGVASLVMPDLAATGLIYAYGIGGLAAGIADILLYIRVERFTGFGPVVSLISGVLSVMAGVVILLYPGAGLQVFSLLFSVWFITHSISRLANLPRVKWVAGTQGVYRGFSCKYSGAGVGDLIVPTAWCSSFCTGVFGRGLPDSYRIGKHFHGLLPGVREFGGQQKRSRLPSP